MAAYTPLQKNETRILHLHPGSEGTSLVGYLTVVQVNAPSFEYESISYAWGQLHHDSHGKLILHHHVRIDEHGDVGIPESLHAALQCFRQSSGIRALWCDAVCIHQEDDIEKSAQVAMMASIFGSAKRVLVWLGPEEAYDQLAFTMSEFCDELYFSSKENPADDWDECKQQLNQRLDASHLGIQPPGYPSYTLAGFAAVANLLRRNWFSRLWVVQEVIDNAETFIGEGRARIRSGSLDMELSRLSRTVVTFLSRCIYEEKSLALEPELVTRITGQAGAGLFGLSGSLTVRSKALPTMVLQNITGLSERQCYDPKDRVFAVYSLLRLNELDGLAPDYSVTATEAYRRLVIACMTARFTYERYGAEKPWTWLALVGTEDFRATGAVRPSWVPHLHYFTPRTREKARLYTSERYSSWTQFRSNPEHFACRCVPADVTKVDIKGLCFGCVTVTSQVTAWPQVAASDSEDQVRVKAKQWYQDCRAFVQKLYLSDDVDFDTLRLLTCGWLHRLPDALDSHSARIVDTHFSGLWGDSTLAPQLKDLFVDSIPFLSLSEIEDVRDRERILVQFTGPAGDDIGWMPSVTRPGDVVCLVAGAPYPLILRGSGHQGYKLLGDAFILKTTLKKALGGECDVGRADLFSKPSMDWNETQDDMLQLIENMDWITIQ